MTTQFQSLVGDLVPTPVTPSAPAAVETPLPKVEGETTVKEPVAVQKNDIPHAIAMTWKHERDAEKEEKVLSQKELIALRNDNAELRRQFLALNSGQARVEPTPAPAAKPDPLKVHIDKYTADFIEENGHAPELSEIPVPAGVYLARDAWQQELKEQEQQSQEVAIRNNAIAIAENETMTDAAFGPGLGITAVVAIGAKYLSKWDRAEIAESGANCPAVMYKKCVTAAIQSGTPEGLDLANRVKARLQAEQNSGATPESLASTQIKDDKQVGTPPPSAEAAIGRHPHLQRLGLKGYGRSA